MVRAFTPDRANKLLRIVRRSLGSVVTCRRVQMVLLSVKGMDAAGIAKITFTSPDQVTGVMDNFSHDGFDSHYPPLRRRADLQPAATSRKIALSLPAEESFPF